MIFAPFNVLKVLCKIKLPRQSADFKMLSERPEITVHEQD